MTVVCANNDEMALGAINALKAGKLLDKVFVGGVDATSEALAAMEAGDLEVTVFQDAKGQGTGGVDAAVDLIAGKAVPDLRGHPLPARDPGQHQGLPGRELGARRPAPPVSALARVVPFGGPVRWASEHRFRPLLPAPQRAERPCRSGQREAGDG